MSWLHQQLLILGKLFKSWMTSTEILYYWKEIINKNPIWTTVKDSDTQTSICTVPDINYYLDWYEFIFKFPFHVSVFVSAHRMRLYFCVKHQALFLFLKVIISMSISVSIYLSIYIYKAKYTHKGSSIETYIYLHMHI